MKNFKIMKAKFSLTTCKYSIYFWNYRFPKGVTLSHHNILNNGYFIGIRLHYTEKTGFVFLFLFIIASEWSSEIYTYRSRFYHGDSNDSFDPKLTLEVVEKKSARPFICSYNVYRYFA